MKGLQTVVEKYVEKYNFAGCANPWRVVEITKIQHYKPNEGYHGWHFERSLDAINTNCINRHLVFMTYLNDVDDAGETEFYYQQLKVKPEIGKTLIWPADWTHTHRGITSPTENKYIITGWFNYM